MNIILGVFYTAYWDIIKEKTNSFDYFDFDNGSTGIKPKWTGKGIEIDMIKPLIPITDVFNFLLDSLYLPLNPKESITCRELDFIISDKKALKKTQFWLKGEEVNTENVLKIIQSVKDNELRFDNLDIKTF